MTFTVRQKVGTFIFLLVTIESMLFLAMQVRVMAACMESQIDKQEYTASAQSSSRDGTGGINQPSDVCVTDPMGEGENVRSASC